MGMKKVVRLAWRMVEKLDFHLVDYLVVMWAEMLEMLKVGQWAEKWAGKMAD
jgi:hypothetical protein